MKETGSYWAQCYGGTVLDAIITAKGLTEGPNKVYNTNIPGIGLRFQRMGAVAMTYPDTFKVSGSNRQKINVYLAGSTFKLQIIKTAENTGSGRITQGGILVMVTNLIQLNQRLLLIYRLMPLPLYRHLVKL